MQLQLFLVYFMAIVEVSVDQERHQRGSGHYQQDVGQVAREPDQENGGDEDQTTEAEKRQQFGESLSQGGKDGFGIGDSGVVMGEL
ncbi:MAG: hypothetical protein Fur0021_21350 [Candidatus Promineifilaceae bacterium]